MMPERSVSMGLADKLAFLSSSNSDGLDNPMYEDPSLSQDGEAESTPSHDISQDGFRDILGPDDGSGRKGKKRHKKNFLEDLVERHDALEEFTSSNAADELDTYLDDLDEDDAELRDSLVSLGRKYHRDSSATGSTSEISKSYAAAEKKLRSLYKEIDDDKVSLQRDIDQMRLARSRNFKALSDMIEAKNTQHNIQLSILDKINRLRKDEYDIKFKEAARAKEEGVGANEVNGGAIRSLFSLGRRDMVSAMGGYEGISGATTEDDEGNPVFHSGEDAPEDHGIEDSNEDGDKFLEFESLGVEYVLLIDEDENIQGLLAESADGEIIPDYPMPTNFSELTFNINKKMGVATDDYHRNYKLRVV